VQSFAHPDGLIRPVDGMAFAVRPGWHARIVARTQAVYYRDSRGTEPVDELTQALPPKRAAKIDEFVDEYLNGQPPEAPPPAFPITSQVDGELRELRVRFANTRYRILYQRSENLVVLLHALEKDTGELPRADIDLARERMADFSRRMDATRRTPPRAQAMTHPRRLGRYDRLIKMDKLVTVTDPDSEVSPQGKTSAAAARGRARRSPEYRAARDEYAAIRALREKNWIAAHIRERRYELDLTQQEVAERAGTSHSFISKLERGEHIPTIPVLTRILAVLDEQLLIGIERKAPGQDPEREVAPAPEPMIA